ncbi:MAG: GTP-binding protein, partial [Alphaproteobacteria bacterium]|nr:GTP-binding protein [Alphaproteobacteria bacterium]
MPGTTPSGPRCAAIVGPYLSGKTTLLEALLHVCDAIPRQGSVKEGNRVGDASEEARQRDMSVELNAATAEYLGERWHFIDCPGSVEYVGDAKAGLMAADVAVVVCDPESAKAMALSSLFQFLDTHNIPRMLFVNKMDHASESVREIMEALQAVSTKPLVLRQMPILDGETVTGYVDLASERAFNYRPGEASEQIDIPADLSEGKDEARFQMMEKLA